MLWLSIGTAAVAPGIALLTYFYLKDKYDAEPLHMVIKIFLVGFLIVFPIMILQRGMQLWLGDNSFVYAFVISAGVEELVKWFVLYHMIYNHTEFDEPYDGIVYAAAVSLGFATIENVLFAWTSHASVGSLLIRAMLPVSGHAMFGVIMGYYLGKAKFSGGDKTGRYLLMSLLLPIFWHGVYDWVLNNVSQYWLWYVVPLMAFLWYGGLGKINRSNRNSPFRPMEASSRD